MVDFEKNNPTLEFWNFLKKYVIEFTENNSVDKLFIIESKISPILIIFLLKGSPHEL